MFSYTDENIKVSSTMDNVKKVICAAQTLQLFLVAILHTQRAAATLSFSITDGPFKVNVTAVLDAAARDLDIAGHLFGHARGPAANATNNGSSGNQSPADLSKPIVSYVRQKLLADKDDKPAKRRYARSPPIGLIPGRGQALYRAGVEETLRQHSKLIHTNRRDMDMFADMFVQQAALSAGLSARVSQPVYALKFDQLANQTRDEYAKGKRRYHQIRSVFFADEILSRQRRNGAGVWSWWATIKSWFGRADVLLACGASGGTLTLVATVAAKIAWARYRSRRRDGRHKADGAAAGGQSNQTHLHLYGANFDKRADGGANGSGSGCAGGKKNNNKSNVKGSRDKNGNEADTLNNNRYGLAISKYRNDAKQSKRPLSDLPMSV